MKSSLLLNLAAGAAAAVLMAFAVGPALADGPEIVAGPAADAECFVPWAADTKFFKYPAKNGPYRIALANGYIANTWRIQMIQTAKAYAAQPDVAAKLKEFKVVSTGEDVAAQISAINNFIDSGYDAIVVNAQNPTAFGAGHQARQGSRRRSSSPSTTSSTPRTRSTSTSTRRASACCGPTGWSSTCPNGGKVLEVRGVAGTSVDTDRHNGIHETLDASGKKWDVVEVVGKWDDGDGPEGDRRRHRRPTASSTASPRRAATPASCRR